MSREHEPPYEDVGRGTAHLRSHRHQPDRTVFVDGVPYTVGRDLEWVGANATTGECDSTTTTPQALRATVDVSWTNIGAIKPVRPAPTPVAGWAERPSTAAIFLPREVEKPYS